MSQEDFDKKFNLERVNKEGVSGPSSVADEIEKLHGLKERGVITEQEFQQRKSKLL